MNEEKHEETMQSTETEIARPELNIKDLILSLAAVFVSACVLSGAVPSVVIGMATAALFAYVIIAIRNVASVIQLLLTSVIVTAFTFLPTCGAAVLALMIGTGVLAWLFMTLPKYKWAPIGLLVVAYGLGFLVTSNPITPLFALAFLPSATLMFWAHARDLGRTSTVLHTFLGFVLVFLAALCAILFRHYGTIHYDVLMSFINELKQLFVTIATEAGKIFWETIELLAAQSAASTESLEKLSELYSQAFSESNLQITADALMGLAPAIVGIPLLIISYLSDVVLLRKYYNTEWRSHMTPAACALTIGPATALIYVVCMVVVLFVQKQSVLLMAVTNMFFLLLPGLCLTGVSAVLFNIRRASGLMKAVSIVLFAATISCMGISSVYFLALWGAYVIVSAALHQKIIEKLKDQNED